MKEKAEQLYREAFDQPRTARSDAYKVGVKAGIRSKLGVEKAILPYTVGTAEADAWFSGNDEGRRIAARATEERAS